MTQNPVDVALVAQLEQGRMLWCTFYGKCKLTDSCGNKVLFLIYGRRELVCKSSLQTVISLFIRVGEFNDTAAWGSTESYLNIWQKDNANIILERKRQRVQLCAFILHPAVIFWREMVSWLHSKPCNIRWFWNEGHIYFPCMLHVTLQFRSVAQWYLTLRPYGLQRARLPCPSPTPRACSNSCPSSWWCHSTISCYINI